MDEPTRLKYEGGVQVGLLRLFSYKAFFDKMNLAKLVLFGYIFTSLIIVFHLC